MKQGTVRTPEEWCDIGNAHLDKIGRRDVHWFVTDGRAVIGWRAKPAGAA